MLLTTDAAATGGDQVKHQKATKMKKSLVVDVNGTDNKGNTGDMTITSHGLSVEVIVIVERGSHFKYFLRGLLFQANN